ALDCFVATLLAMTKAGSPHPPRHCEPPKAARQSKGHASVRKRARVAPYCLRFSPGPRGVGWSGTRQSTAQLRAHPLRNLMTRNTLLPVKARQLSRRMGEKLTM